MLKERKRTKVNSFRSMNYADPAQLMIDKVAPDLADL